MRNKLPKSEWDSVMKSLPMQIRGFDNTDAGKLMFHFAARAPPGLPGTRSLGGGCKGLRQGCPGPTWLSGSTNTRLFGGC